MGGRPSETDGEREIVSLPQVLAITSILNVRLERLRGEPRALSEHEKRGQERGCADEQTQDAIVPREEAEGEESKHKRHPSQEERVWEGRAEVLRHIAARGHRGEDGVVGNGGAVVAEHGRAENGAAAQHHGVLVTPARLVR